MNDSPNKPNRKAAIQGGLVIALPLIAVIAAYVFFPANSEQQKDLLDWLGTTNHGTLIEPKQTIEGEVFTTASGQSWQVGENTKWKLLVASNGPCDEPCQQALYLTRQIHTLIPKRKNRLERAYISDQPASDSLLQLLKEAHADIPALVDNGAFQAQLANTNAPQNCQGCYYLVAPNGELVLFYTPEHEYKKVIKDLKVLL